jgi:Fic family protein
MANPGKMAKAALAYGLMLGHGPFSEKNGLLGRLLINLILFSKNSGNEEPGQPLCLPYLSLCLAKRAEKSQEILDGIRRSRNLAWDEWMAIIAAAISEAAELSRSFLRALATASQRDIKKIEGLGRAGQGCAQIQAAMLERPITQAMQLSQKSGLCPATVNKALAHLGQLGIIAKLGKEKRNRLFAYKAVLEAMDNPGTERLKIW